MEKAFLLTLVGVTSVGLYVLGGKRFGCSARGLQAAVAKVVECVGATLLMFGLNLAVAGMSILALRTLTGMFISLHPVNDVVWLVLSLLQALTFEWWRELSPRAQNCSVGVRSGQK